MSKNALIIAVSLNVVLFAVFALVALAIVTIVDDQARSAALEEAEAKAHMLLVRNLATHTYFTTHLKPRVLDLTEKSRSEGYFEPSWMSSTYAVRETLKLFSSDESFSDYYYKEAAINARTPENEADEHERDFIMKLNRDPDLEMESGVRTIDGKEYYVVMRRGEKMEETCLMCHSTPGAAPSGLVERYGGERSFGRSEGETVSALSLRIPLSAALARADELSGRLKVLLLLVLSILLAMQIYLTNWLRRSREALSVSLEKKDILMREIHHRVKNNLSVIQSLLNLQLRDIDDARSREHFLDIEGRVKSMSMIHERLHDASDITSIALPEYVRSLVGALFSNYVVGGRDIINVTYDIQDIHLDVDTMIPLGLIINELISNAIKYAFPGDTGGDLSISLRETGKDRYELVVSDTGPGLPEGLDIETSGSLGLKIVSSLASQLDGKVAVNNEKGAEFRISFKSKPVK